MVLRHSSVSSSGMSCLRNFPRCTLEQIIHLYKDIVMSLTVNQLFYTVYLSTLINFPVLNFRLLLTLFTFFTSRSPLDITISKFD